MYVQGIFLIKIQQCMDFAVQLAGGIIELSLREISFFTCTRSCARANDAKIVRSRNTQSNTKELP